MFGVIIKIPSDRLIYLEHEEEEPFVKEPLGGIPPLGSLRVGSLTVIAELTKIEVYRRRIWGLNIIPKLCALFTKRMGYLLKFAPDRLAFCFFFFLCLTALKISRNVCFKFSE